MDKETKKTVMSRLLTSRNRQELLSKATSAERFAMKILRDMGLSPVFQQPFYTGRNTYYADIYIPHARLVLEIDGGYHFSEEQKRKDENRSANLRRLGVHVCRLSNSDARDPKKVRSKILRYLIRSRINWYNIPETKEMPRKRK